MLIRFDPATLRGREVAGQHNAFVPTARDTANNAPAIATLRVSAAAPAAAGGFARGAASLKLARPSASQRVMTAAHPHHPAIQQTRSS